MLPSFIKDIIRKSIPNKLKEFINYTPSSTYFKKSYSQEGEDIMLDLMMGYKRKGVYIDIGAHHPYKFSNTYYFYKMGWNGVCVDPIPNSEELFLKARPRDVFINKGVGLRKGFLNYYKMKDPALNTFVKEVKDKRIKNGHGVDDVLKVEIVALSNILEKHLKCEKIDFMSIDVEGFEEEVLASNDWTRFKPTFIIIHYKSKSIEDCINSEIGKFLKEKGYFMFAKSFHSLFFRLNF